MPTPTDSRARGRGRVEAAIRVFAPFLDLLLFVGERTSRVLQGDDPAYTPARMAAEGERAPRGLGDYRG